MLLTRGEWEQYEVENLETGLVTGWGEGEKDWDPAWSEPACSKRGSSTIQIEDTPEKISYCDQEVPLAKENVPLAKLPDGSGDTSASIPCTDSASSAPKDDDFVAMMLQDPDLPCNPEMAVEMYRFLQRKAGSQLTEALKTIGENAPPPKPEEVQKPPSHGEPGDKDAASSTTPQRIEKYHEDWNSSQSITSAGSMWESPEEELEDKIARTQRCKGSCHVP